MFACSPGPRLFYSVAGRVGANARERERVVRAVKKRIEEAAFVLWDETIPPTWCCFDASAPETLGGLMHDNGFVDFAAYRRALRRTTFEGTVDELWLLALAYNCRFHVYRGKRIGTGSRGVVYDHWVTAGVDGPVVRRLLWVPARTKGGSHHYNLLLPKTAHTAPHPTDTDVSWMLSDEEVRGRLLRRRGALTVA